MIRTLRTSRRRLFTTAAMLVALASASVTAAFAETVKDIQAKGIISVGVLVDFPPFGLLGSDGKPEGYDIDLAKLLAKKMGVKIDIVPVAGNNRVPYLVTKKVDILVAALGITPERSKQVDFSEPDAQVDQVLYAPKDLDIKSLDDLSGKSIGVALGSAQDVTLTKVAPDDVHIKRFGSDPATLQALLSGQVDAIALSTLMIKDISKVANVDRFEIKFPIQHLVHGIAMRKGSDDLKAWINNFLSEIKANGQLDAISQKWIGVDFTPVKKAQEK